MSISKDSKPKKKKSKKKEDIPGLDAVLRQGKNYRKILKRYSKK